MKNIIVLSLIALLAGCQIHTKTEAPNDMPQETIENQRVRLGADKYGMRKYVMAFLKVGPNRDRTKEEAAKLQRAHLDNIGRLAKAGKLAVAGPFLDQGDIRGIYIFAVETIEEAEELTNSDPAIQAGSLVMELKPWYGSAALMEVNQIHEKIAEVAI